MAPPRPAVVQYASLKSCFLQIPDTWKYTFLPDNVLTFEVSFGTKVLYFSWSGGIVRKCSLSYDEVVEIDALYARKLGIEQGQQVLVKEVGFVPSCSQVWVEPISSDDWEMLETDGELVRSQLLDQVRIVFVNQVLPVWISAGVHMFLLVTQLSCSSHVGQMNPSTELLIKPKFRDSGIGSEWEGSSASSPSMAVSPTEAASSLSNFDPVVASTPATSIPRSSSSSLFSRVFKFLGVEQQECISPVTEDNSNVKWLSKYWCDNSTTWKIIARISTLTSDVNECKEDDNKLLHLLMSQSTTAFVSEESLPFFTSNHISNHNQSHIAFLTRMQKISSPVEKQEEKTKHSREAEERNSGTDVRGKPSTCFIKLVPIESLQVKDCTCMTALRQMLSFPSRVAVSSSLAFLLKLEIGSQVILEAEKFHIQDVTKVVVKRYKHQSVESQMCPPEIMKSLLNESTDSTCPLVLNPTTILSLNFRGEQEYVSISVGGHRSRKEKAECDIFQLLPLQNCNDVTCVYSDDLPPAVLNFTTPKFRDEYLGAVGDLMSEGIQFLRFQLKLTSLAKSLSVAGGPRCMCIVGPRGSGKSAVVEALCQKVAAFPYRAHYEIIHCKQLKGKRSEAIYKLWKKTFAVAVYKAPSVVVLDDLDHLCGSSSSDERNAVDALQEQIATMLLNLLKYELEPSTSVGILATCCTKEALHPLLLSTRGCHVFAQFLALQPLNLQQREEVLKSLLLQRECLDSKSSNNCNLSDVAKQTDGAVAQDLNLIVEKAVYSAISNSKNNGDLLLEDEHFSWALDGFTPANLKDIAKNLTLLSKGWDDVGGLGDVKKTLEEIFFWPTKYPELFAQCPLRLSTGLLLYGPPGTGKTLTAGALAKECSLNFISIKGPELLSKYIGASEQAVRDLFYKAQSARPCILFFDEFDAIAPRRGHDSTGVTDRVVNQLLTQMDGVEERTGVYVLAATSRPDLIDPALLRPGRLDKCLQCPLPTKEEQLEIVRTLSRSLNLDASIDWTVVTETWDNFSGADLQALLFDAQLLAIRQSSVFGESNPSMDKGSSSVEWFCIPNLEHGCVEEIGQEKRNNIQKEVETMVARERWGSGNDDCSSWTTVQRGQVCRVSISQNHLIQAGQRLKPSVSPTERLRYQKIYATFVQSRGGDFSTMTSSDVKRATLA